MSDAPQMHRLAAAFESTLWRLGVTAAALAVAVFLATPRASPFLLLAMAAPTLALAVPRTITDLGLDRPAVALGIVFAGYLLMNSLWSLDRADAFGKVLLLAAMLMALAIASRGLPRMPDEALAQMTRIALIGGGAALLYLLIEEVTWHAIKTAIFNWLPFTRPSEKHIQLDGDRVTNPYLYVSNRSMAALMFALWPALLVMPALAWSGVPAAVKRWLLPAGVVAVVAYVLSKSQHDTSEIALALSLVAFVVALVARRLALWLLVAGWLVATLLTMPMVDQAYKAGLHTAKWLPETGRHRIIIWGYTAEQYVRTPLLGVGLGSGKVLDARNKSPEQPADHIYPRRTGTHSHNVYVQTWYELGAVGALLLCAFGLAILSAITRLDERVQPYAVATFTTAATMAAFSWGMWQPWFMACFGISALLFLIAAEQARRHVAED